MTETMQIQLKKIAQTCEQAIYESEMAIGDNEKGYPYASGYCRSALKYVLDDVNFLLKSHDSNSNN
jgi:hypothetical protein